MIKKTKFFQLFLPSEYTHWGINFCIPLQGTEGWDETDRANPIYRASLIIGFWRLFLVIYLWKTAPRPNVHGNIGCSEYGITFFERSIHYHWAGKTWVRSLPWDWQIVRWDLLYPNGDVYWSNRYKNGKAVNKEYSWYYILKETEGLVPKTSGAETEVAKFVHITYRTQHGEVQQAKIRLTGEEREWRWKWLAWVPFINMKKRVVDCDSDIPIGERVHTWKGGLTGWGCEWKHGETLEDAFWRWYKTWDGR